VKQWFKEQNIPFKEKNIFTATLDPNELKSILSKTENGTEDIISNRSNIMKANKVNIEDLTINELVSFIKNNPSVLKRPIMVDDRRVQVGYDPEEIRTFIPAARRIAEMYCSHDGNCSCCKDCSKNIEK